MQVIVAGTIDFEGDAAKVLLSGQDYIAEALEEKGCHAYAWAVDPARPSRVLVFERWETVEDLGAHLHSKPYRDMSGHLDASGLAGAEVHCFSVAGIEPVYSVDGGLRDEIFGVKIG